MRLAYLKYSEGMICAIMKMIHISTSVFLHSVNKNTITTVINQFLRINTAVTLNVVYNFKRNFFMTFSFNSIHSNYSKLISKNFDNFHWQFVKQSV